MNVTKVLSLLGAVVTTAGAVVSVAACSDGNPPVSSSSGAPYTPPVSTDGGGGSTDGGAPRGDAGDCSSAEQRGTAVQEVAMVGKNDTPAGGTIKSGVYVLKEIYTGLPAGTEPVEALTEYFAQKTLTIDADAGTYLLIEAEGQGAVGASVVSGGSFAVTGTELVLTNTCPGGSDKRYGFTAVGLAVILFNGQHQELFFP